jgi:glycosyltransferase involved in cell wall biosynthesis
VSDALRLLFIVPEWPPHVVGGGGYVFSRIARGLRARGHEITVAHGEYTNTNPIAIPSRRRDLDGLTRYILPLLPTPSSMRWLETTLPPTPPAAMGLARLIAGNRWDVISLHGTAFPLIDASAFLARRLGIRHAFTVHGVPEGPFERGALVGACYRAYYKLMTRRTILFADGLTAVSQAIMRHPLLDIREAVIIANGIDADAFDETVDHTIPSAPPRLISLSRLSHHKGIDIAVEAVTALTNQGMDIRYDIHGADAGEQTHLQTMIAQSSARERIVLHGKLLASERNRAFAQADLCVIPSRRESFGLVALEAMAAGLPVVATDVEGLPEVVEGCAILAKPNDPQSLQTAIRSALEPRRRKEMIAQGRARARTFLWDDIVTRYESFFRSLAHSATNR